MASESAHDPNGPKWSRGLDGPALSIASCNDSPLRVCAGPGTGKSFALRHRVARLLEEGVAPERVFLVTFTRVAARDLVKELGTIDVDGGSDVECGTLHSFCLKTLQKSAVLEITGRTARPLMAFELRFLLEDVKRTDRGIRQCEKMLHAFEADWARLQHENVGWPSDPKDQQFHRDMMSWLEFHESILLGELPTLMRTYLANNPACAEKRLFDHVLVDEYQDLNKADQAVIDLLAENGTLSIIGDEDQAIYSSFRHAQPESIRDFPKYHQNTHDEYLDVCRRCPSTVVTIANSLISRNQFREVRSLLPHAARGAGLVEIVQWPTMAEEAAGLAKLIRLHVENHNVSPGEILVLVPRQSQGVAIRTALFEEGVSSHSYFFEEALRNDESRERYSLLTLLAKPKDRVALRCWLGFGHSTRAAVPYARLRQYCEQNGLDPFDALGLMAEGRLSLPGSEHLLVRWKKLQCELSHLKSLNHRDLVDALFPDGNSDLLDLRALSLTSIQEGSEELDASGLLGDLAPRIYAPEPPTEDGFVRIMSLHKAKGLTANTTFVAGCIQGWLPSVDDSLSDAEAGRAEEEQRRLFYVAITRSTETLVLSSFLNMPNATMLRTRGRSRSRPGRNALGLASTFLGELGPDAPNAISGDALIRKWS